MSYLTLAAAYLIGLAIIYAESRAAGKRQRQRDMEAMPLDTEAALLRAKFPDSDLTCRLLANGERYWCAFDESDKREVDTICRNNLAMAINPRLSFTIYDAADLNIRIRSAAYLRQERMGRFV